MTEYKNKVEDYVQSDLNAVHCRMDRWMLTLLFVQWIASLMLALWISPRTWLGSSFSPHIHVMAAAFIGGAATIYPMFLVYFRPGAPITRHVIAISQVSFSSLLIHLCGGRLEMHFHVFGSLAFLAFYRDWKVLLSATTVIAIDHFVRGLYFPQSVFGVIVAEPYRWLEHAMWVVFEDVFLINSCLQSLRDMRGVASRQVETEFILSRITSIMNQIPDGLLVVDKSGKISQVNPMTGRMLDKKLHLLKGSSAKYLLGRERSHEMEAILQNNETNITMEIELAFGRNGELTSKKIFSEDSSIGHIIIIRDITQSKKIDQMKSEFIATISHELRTPFTSILGFSKINQKKLQKALEGIDPESTKAFKSLNQAIIHTDIIITECGRLLRIVNDLLDISKLESGKMQCKPICIDVAEILKTNTIKLSSLLNPDKVNVEVEIPEHLPQAFADQEQVTQILTNLLSNAIKFTDHGNIVCSARSENGQMLISVKDSGMGIAASDLNLIFDRFQQVGNVMTDKPKGTGLGLPICKELAQLNGGDIWAESKMGRGSTFTFSLPIAEI